MLRTFEIISVAAVIGAGIIPGTPTAHPSTAPTNATVNATPDMTFNPSPATVSQGATVTFAFGSLPHNVYFDSATGAPADIPGVNSNTNTSRKFEKAGTYVFRCRLHPGMKGTIVVTDGASAPSHH